MLEVGGLRRVGPWTLVPLQLTDIRPSWSDTWTYVHATKRPYALILVRGHDAPLALDTEGRDIPVAPLLAEVPALEEILSDVEARLPGTLDDRRVSKE